jgi:adenine-specific DNA-methyltransferase
MKLITKTIPKSLSPSLKAFKPSRISFDHFKTKLKEYLDVIDHKESEENLKTHLMKLLQSLYGQQHLIEQQERIDFVIRIGGKKSPAGVLVESKRRSNKADMITASDCNRKAMHELILYYMRERTNGNTDIRNLIICSEHEFSIFDAKAFERNFFKNAAFRKNFDDWAAGRKSDTTTDFFYNQIAKPHIASLTSEIEATHFDLSKAIAEIEKGNGEREQFGLVTVLCRSLESLTLDQGDRRDEEAYRRFQAGGSADCIEQRAVTATGCVRFGGWPFDAGEVGMRVSAR